ncbi:MAG: enoyl-CoA hydratase-related protein, partial [Actinomycetota bacterium]
GLFAGGGGMFLGTRIPIAVALELALTGDMIDAERAHTLGLVNLVVPGEEVLDAAFSLAARLTDNAPLAMAATKRLMREALDSTREQVWLQQDELRPALFDSNDAKEGAQAFIQKRRPIGTGT